MGVQSANIIDANMVLKLLSWLSSLLEEVGTEPDLFEMRFMRVFCQNLFYGYFSLWWSVNAEPDYTKTSSSKQTNPLEILWKSFAKFVVLISS